MTFAMIRRSLAATAVLAAIAAPSAMACHGTYTPPPKPGDTAGPCATSPGTYASYGGRHHRYRGARNCTPTPPPVTPPPVVTPPVDPPPVDPGPSL